MTGRRKVQPEDAQSSAQWVRAVSEVALLSILGERPHYGLEILDRLRSEAALQIAEGTIYPLLHRLERAGLVSAEWSISEAERPRKYYALTPAGARELEAQLREWGRLSRRLEAFLGRMAG
ncbi:MAG TPA: PadR family transcriptional regulator [Caulobacteraceae bacterium]|jgi:PadR family transcriptional regulator PadR